MSHKIESTANVAPLSPPRASSRPSEGMATAALTPRDDSLSLTGNARMATDILQAAVAAPAVDTARVANVRHALDNGQYHVDSEAVATRLMRLEWELSTT